MNVIAALGNPGDKYEHTRHNAGRLLMREVLRHWRFPDMVASAKYGGEISEGTVGAEEVRVLFPGTYMNESGRSIVKAVESGQADKLIVIYDEIDIPLGEFKLTFGRGSGGHNGLKSVIDAVGTPNFLRLRVGIAHRTFFGNVVRPTGDRLADYVLGQLSSREEKKLLSLADEVARALKIAITEGKEKAMTMFN